MDLDRERRRLLDRVREPGPLGGQLLGEPRPQPHEAQPEPREIDVHDAHSPAASIASQYESSFRNTRCLRGTVANAPSIDAKRSGRAPNASATNVRLPTS